MDTPSDGFHERLAASMERNKGILDRLADADGGAPVYSVEDLAEDLGVLLARVKHPDRRAILDEAIARVWESALVQVLDEEDEDQ